MKKEKSSEKDANDEQARLNPQRLRQEVDVGAMSGSAAGAGEDDEVGDTISNMRQLALSDDVPRDKDDIPRALKWIEETCGLDAKGLAKHLPHAANDLREGKLSPDELVELLIPKPTDTIMANILGEEMPVVSYFYQSISYLTIPESWARNAVQKEWLNKTTTNFSYYMMGRFYRYVDKWEVDFMASMQSALRETCEEWAGRVNKMLFEERRMFPFVCPMYDLSPDEFHTKVNELLAFAGLSVSILKQHILEDYQDTNRKRVRSAAVSVQEGVLDTFQTCWECETPCDNLQQCSRCKVALYCCRNCQVRAWKGGHKGKCKILKEHHASLLESQEIVAKAHESGALGEFTLNEGFDYCLASFLPTERPRFDVEYNKLEAEGCPRPQGPSMKYFYENLGRAVRGEWWFDRLGDYTSGVEVLCTARAEQEGETDEKLHFYDLCYCLCYDHVGFLASVEAGRVSDTRAINATVKAISDDAEGFGMVMPAARFLQLYQDSFLQRHRMKKFKLARELKNDMLSKFRAKHHK